MLADQAKSLFISKFGVCFAFMGKLLISLKSISHELRTPLHGVRLDVFLLAHLLSDGCA
jgi:hypothetical protein